MVMLVHHSTHPGNDQPIVEFISPSDNTAPSEDEVFTVSGNGNVGALMKPSQKIIVFLTLLIYSTIGPLNYQGNACSSSFDLSSADGKIFKSKRY